MNARSYSSASAFRTALETRLNGLAKQQGIDVQRLRRQLSFDRFLARVFATNRPGWALKGGYALELRLPFPRATKDVDLSVTSSELVGLIGAEQSVALLEILREAATVKLPDFFSYEVGAELMELDAPYGGYRFPVMATVAGRSFVRFHLDIGIGDASIEPLEILHGHDFLEFAGLPTISIPAISKEQHFAEKFHAYTLPRESTNSRVKDLIDMVVLLDSELDSVLLRNAIVLTFERRKTHPIPNNIEAPPDSWVLPFANLAQECGFGGSCNDALGRITEHLRRIRIVL